MSRIEVITAVQRRRRWSWEEKERIVAASRLPGAVASEVARRAEIPVSQLFRWRRQLGARGRAGPAFAAVAGGTGGCRTGFGDAARLSIRLADGWA